MQDADTCCLHAVTEEWIAAVQKWTELWTAEARAMFYEVGLNVNQQDFGILWWW